MTEAPHFVTNDNFWYWAENAGKEFKEIPLYGKTEGMKWKG